MEIDKNNAPAEEIVEVTPPSSKNGVIAKKADWLRWIFFNKNGLRIIWLVLIFILIFLLLNRASNAVLHNISWVSSRQPILPAVAFLREVLGLFTVFLATSAMSLIERRSVLSYGYKDVKAVSNLLTGLACGFISLPAVVLLLWKSGFLAISGFSLHGTEAVQYAFIWAVAFFMLGFIEESIFRGYLQHTLSRGIGFWPAALLVSVGFILWHVSNSGETILGLSAAVLVSLAFCLSLWYTRSLWWAIGFHTSWDWSQNYFYGTPDSGVTTQGHLLNTRPLGNPFWSGGTTGPEGSAFVFPLFLLLSIGMWLYWSGRFRRKIPSKI